MVKLALLANNGLVCFLLVFIWLYGNVIGRLCDGGNGSFGERSM